MKKSSEYISYAEYCQDLIDHFIKLAETNVAYSKKPTTPKDLQKFALKQAKECLSHAEFYQDSLYMILLNA